MITKVLKVGIVTIAVVGLLVAAVLLLIPSQPSDRGREVSEFAAEPFISGTELLLREEVLTFAASPREEFLWSALSAEELIQRLAVDNAHMQVQFIGTAASGHQHYLVSVDDTVEGTSDHYSLISYGPVTGDRKKPNRYTLMASSTTFYYDDGPAHRVDGELLFPCVLIDDDELPYFSLAAGETYPMVGVQGELFASAADVLDYITGFYAGSPWYEIVDSGSEVLVVALAEAVDAELIEENHLYEGAFEIAVLASETGYEIAVDRG